jgi:hypothetical protein
MAAVQDLLGGEPSDAEDGPATAQRLKRPRFTRAEAEINGTYVFSHMSLQAGDDLLQWACNEAFRYRDVRYGSMRSLSKAIRSTYAPGNVLSTNFHEPLDGPTVAGWPGPPGCIIMMIADCCSTLIGHSNYDGL